MITSDHPVERIRPRRHRAARPAGPVERGERAARRALGRSPHRPQRRRVGRLDLAQLLRTRSAGRRGCWRDAGSPGRRRPPPRPPAPAPGDQRRAGPGPLHRRLHREGVQVPVRLARPMLVDQRVEAGASRRPRRGRDSLREKRGGPRAARRVGRGCVPAAARARRRPRPGWSRPRRAACRRAGSPGGSASAGRAGAADRRAGPSAQISCREAIGHATPTWRAAREQDLDVESVIEQSERLSAPRARPASPRAARDQALVQLRVRVADDRAGPAVGPAAPLSLEQDPPEAEQERQRRERHPERPADRLARPDRSPSSESIRRATKDMPGRPPRAGPEDHQIGGGDQRPDEEARGRAPRCRRSDRPTAKIEIRSAIAAEITSREP